MNKKVDFFGFKNEKIIFLLKIKENPKWSGFII